MRKPKTDAPPNLLKPWPASFDGLLCAKCRGGGMDALCGACARSEVRRLRGEVRRLRLALRKIALGPECLSQYGMEQEARSALAPRRRKT